MIIEAKNDGTAHLDGLTVYSGYTTVSAGGCYRAYVVIEGTGCASLAFTHFALFERHEDAEATAVRVRTTKTFNLRYWRLEKSDRGARVEVDPRLLGSHPREAVPRTRPPV